MPRCRADGGWLDYRLHGSLDEGPAPIVLLHHGFGHADGWGTFPERLRAATGRPILAYSRRGCGRSDPLDGPRRPGYLEHEARVVLPALIEELELARVCLYGHSDGASIALLAAAAGLPGLEAVVAEAPHIFVEPETIAGVRDAVRRHDEDPAFRQALARQHADPEGAFGSWRDIWLDADFARWSMTEHLHRIRVPLLLIQGDADEYGTLAQIEGIRSRVAGPVTVRILPGCGHQPHREASDVPEAVAEFLGNIRRR